MNDASMSSGLTAVLLAALIVCGCSSTDSVISHDALPGRVKQVIENPRYRHSTWGIIVIDLASNQVVYQKNASKVFLPASTTKLFAVSALLDSYGMDHRFRTPVYALGKLRGGTLEGDLVLVGRGDLTLGGRRTRDDQIAFTNFDHVDANAMPGTVLTQQDPLAGLAALARQVRQAGIETVRGEVLIDGRLFHRAIKRGDVLSPIFINDNLFDFTAMPTETGKPAKLSWRPRVPGIRVINRVKTVARHTDYHLELSANADQSVITVSGVIGQNQTNIINTLPIKEPEALAQAAFTEALRKAGVAVRAGRPAPAQLPDPSAYRERKPVATLTSAPLSEYAKLILKVSHNIGANLVPLLLAARQGKRSYPAGMRAFGEHVEKTLGVEPGEYLFEDAAGGNANRVCPLAEIKLLKYWYAKPKATFERFVATLPILGVDGSLAMVARESSAKGRVFAKTGTGVSINPANGRLFLTTKTLAGYMKTEDGRWLAFMIAVNNSPMDSIETVFSINNDVGLVASGLYEGSRR